MVQFTTASDFDQSVIYLFDSFKGMISIFIFPTVQWHDPHIIMFYLIAEAAQLIVVYSRLGIWKIFTDIPHVLGSLLEHIRF